MVDEKRDELFKYLIEHVLQEENHHYQSFKMLLLLIEDVIAEKIDEDEWKSMVIANASLTRSS